jgi:fibrillarin-like pre-rRNA processing protein
MKIKKDKKIEGLYWVNRRPATKNLVKRKMVYGEKLVKKGGDEFRLWDPTRSKLCAAILKGCKELGFKKNSKVLYLGAASGTTVSHVSDMLPDGRVYALDVAPRVVRELLSVAHERENLFPMLFNANLPKSYANLVEDVDLVYQDVAQKNQVQILVKNSNIFLKSGGYALLALKARSVDVTKKPGTVFEMARQELSKHFKILRMVRLEPYEKDHAFFVLRKV